MEEKENLQACLVRIVPVVRDNSHRKREEGELKSPLAPSELHPFVSLLSLFPLFENCYILLFIRESSDPRAPRRGETQGTHVRDETLGEGERSLDFQNNGSK